MRQNTTNTRYADNSSKIVFENEILCAQFLRDFAPVKQLKNIKPEDIEDVSERFVHFFAEQRDADTVKRIWLNDETPFYLISLIEHKSSIDYNVSMQILRYMVYIWEDYEKEMKKARESGENTLVSTSKDFKYPPVLPIVYYEGQQKWTVPRNLKWRITEYEEMKDYIPDFNYELVQLNDYTTQELIDKKDEISLIMMFNSLQNSENINNMLTNVNIHELEEILKETPPHILDIMANVIRALCRKINMPEAETDKLMELVKEVKMGILFENMEHMDIQEERRKTKEALGQLEKVRNELFVEIDHKKKELADKNTELASKNSELASKNSELASKNSELASKTSELANMAERFAKSIITTCLEKNQTRKYTCLQVMQELEISAELAEEYLQKYWSDK